MTTQYSIEDAPAAPATGTQYSVEDAPDERPFWQRWKDNFNANTQGAKPGETGVKAAVENFGAGGGDVVRSLAHPIRTAEGLVQSIQPDPGAAGIGEAALGPGGAFIVHNIQSAIQNPARFAGQVGTGALLGEAAGGVGKVAGKVASKGADIMTGGTKAASDLSKTVTDANANAAKTAADANAKAAQTHLDATQDALHETAGRELAHQQAIKNAQEAGAKADAAHDQAVQVVDAANKAKMDDYANQTRSIEDENAKQQVEYQQDKAKADEVAKAAQEQETQRGQLARAVQEQSSRMVDRLRTVKAAAKDKADAMYKNVREKTAGASVPSTQLADAVHQAQGLLKGSTENIKQFNDVLSKYPEGDPDFVNYQGSQIPKGHPLYDVLKEQGEVGSAKPAAFADLQGYYTELGDKLSGGNLPSDVYRAVTSLRDNIGNMMQKMASDNNAGAAFKNAQNYYRDYYQTFREMTGPNHTGSPIANALSAKDPTYAIKPLTVDETAQRVRNSLARFDPAVNGRGGAAQLYDNFRDVSRKFDATGKPIKVPESPAEPTPKAAPTAPTLQPKPTAPTPVTVPPVERVSPPMRPEVVQAQTRFISPEDIQSVKQDILQQHTAAIRRNVNKAAVYVTGYRSLVAIGRALSGDAGALSALPADVGEGVALAAGGHGLAALLESPRVSKFLTAPTPADVATINPEIAQGLAPIIQQAKARGIKVSPALAAAVSAHATKTDWFDQPR